MEEVEVTPRRDQVLVKVYAASLTYSNLMLVTGKPLFVRFIDGGTLRKPGIKIPGSDVAGTVEAVGKDVTHFHPGDEVIGYLAGDDGRKGAYAEYVCAAENAFGAKPANLTWEQAAAVPEAALVALQAVRDDGKLQKGQKVLVHGASGGIGNLPYRSPKPLVQK
jgi:NADPH:quinone reductase-like Zn-dependent oxidoreductase